MNWLKKGQQIWYVAVEGLNKTLNVVTRMSDGSRTFQATEIVLYQALGDSA